MRKILAALAFFAVVTSCTPASAKVKAADPARYCFQVVVGDPSGNHYQYDVCKNVPATITGCLVDLVYGPVYGAVGELICDDAVLNH